MTHATAAHPAAGLNRIGLALGEAADILKRANDEAALVEKVRWHEQLVNHAPAGSRRHVANLKLCDALAELDSFRQRARDPQGFGIGYGVKA